MPFPSLPSPHPLLSPLPFPSPREFPRPRMGFNLDLSNTRSPPHTQPHSVLSLCPTAQSSQLNIAPLLRPTLLTLSRPMAGLGQQKFLGIPDTHRRKTVNHSQIGKGASSLMRESFSVSLCNGTSPVFAPWLPSAPPCYWGPQRFWWAMLCVLLWADPPPPVLPLTTSQA